MSDTSSGTDEQDCSEFHGAPARRHVIGGLVAVAGLMAFPRDGSAQLVRTPPGAVVGPPQPIEVTATPIAAFERTAPSRRQHGRLEFRGGLVLGSPVREFGGWSGLVMSEDGRRMLAISDQGSWMTANLVYDGTRPAALADVTLGDIPGIGGRKLNRWRDKDAEAITVLDGTLTRGNVLIAFERNHRIGRFPISGRSLGPPAGYLKMPAETRRMKPNKGLEAITIMRGGPLKGSVLAFAEELPDADRNHTGWIWPGGVDAEPQRLGLVNISDFAITDAPSLPDGSLIVLERKFRGSKASRMRLRLVRAAAIQPGALLDGEVLLEADMSAEIDNMEALALSRDARGATVLTLCRTTISTGSCSAICCCSSCLRRTQSRRLRRCRRPASCVERKVR